VRITSNKPVNRRTVAGQTIEAEILCGVYLIVCYATGDMYVGSSVDVKRRWRQHRSVLRGDRSSCAKLQTAWDRYPEQFSFSLLRECLETELHKYEQYYIDMLNPVLNSAPAAGTNKGFRMSADQRARLRLRPQSTPKLHRVGDEMLTAAEVARRLGVRVGTVHRRVQMGTDIARPIEHQTPPALLVHGESLTPREIAARYGLPLTTIYTRLRLGWSGDQLAIPRKHRARNSR